MASSRGLGDLIPDIPQFSQEDWDECRRLSDFGLILFEWYRWVGILSTTVAFVAPESPDFEPIPDVEYHHLAGLMARCARLMMATVALTHERQFGEAAAILLRSQMETSVKIAWICRDNSTERSQRIIATSLRPEIEFEKIIFDNISDRSGEELPIETRMLKSIDNPFIPLTHVEHDA